MNQNINNNSLHGRGSDTVSMQPQKGAGKSAPAKRLTMKERREKARRDFEELFIKRRQKDQTL
jgi:hypothetical protein